MGLTQLLTDLRPKETVIKKDKKPLKIAILLLFLPFFSCSIIFISFLHRNSLESVGVTSIY